MENWPLRLLVGGLIFLVVIELTKDSVPNLANKRRCEAEEKVVAMKLEGIILKKYRNKEYDKTVRLLHVSGDTSELDIFILDHNLTYDKLNEGDSLFKELGSLVMAVKRDQSQLTFDLDFNCNQKE